MSIQHGKTNLSIYKIKNKNMELCSSDILDDADLHGAIPMTAVIAKPDGESLGWSSGTVLLDNTITEENSRINESCIALNLRITSRKINAGLLKATIQRDEEAFKKANGRDRVPRNERTKIKKDAMERLRPGGTIAVRGIEVVFDKDYLLIGSTSQKDCDLVTTLLSTDFGMNMSFPEHRNAKGESHTAGREFLTWLFKKIQADGNEVLPGTEVMIEGPLNLVASDSGDGSKCTSANMKGELVTESTEVQHMLDDQHKQILKARVTMVRNDDIWKFTFDANTWTFGALELPKTCKTPEERIEAIREFYEAFDAVFAAWKLVNSIIETKEV